MERGLGAVCYILREGLSLNRKAIYIGERRGVRIQQANLKGVGKVRVSGVGVDIQQRWGSYGQRWGVIDKDGVVDKDRGVVSAINGSLRW